MKTPLIDIAQEIFKNKEQIGEKNSNVPIYLPPIWFEKIDQEFRNSIFKKEEIKEAPVLSKWCVFTNNFTTHNCIEFIKTTSNETDEITKEFFDKIYSKL